MRLAVLALATATSAVLYGLSFPPSGLRPMAWVALVPFLVAARRATPPAVPLLAWLWTLGAAYAVGDWFPRAVSTYYGQSGAVGLAFFFAVSTFMAALYYMAFAVCYPLLARKPDLSLPLL